MTVRRTEDALMSMLASNRNDDLLLYPAEVAMIFRVDPKTVSRWSRAGKIEAIKTPGKHRRFRAGEVRRVLEEGGA